MSNTFDPYHKWLGIPANEQPANRYRLLGIAKFEDDPDVIEAAADQRMAHVRTYQAGKNSALSQRILNELSAAKLCLLDTRKKSAYDTSLRSELPLEAKPASAVASSVAAAAGDDLLEQLSKAVAASESSAPPLRRGAARRPQVPGWQAIAGVAATLAVALIALFWLGSSGGRKETGRVANAASETRRAAAIATEPIETVKQGKPQSSPGDKNDKYIDITLAPGVVIRLVKIPASKDGKTKEFYLGQTEVTQKQWETVMESNPALTKGDRLPVTNIVFDEAAMFCERVQARASMLAVRLPSFEEQQNAQFAGFASDQRPHLEDFAWLRSESPNGMHAVGTKRPDALELYDMIGNVNEWCEGGRQIAGGNWGDPLETWDARQIRALAEVWKLSPNWHDNNCGLRIAADTR